MTTYKAWTYRTGGFPNCLEQITQTAPDSLSPTQLLIRIKSAALNPFDVQIMNSPLWSLPLLRGIVKGIGEDFSGVVIRAGERSGFRSGDDVFGFHWVSGSRGTLAEVLVVDSERDIVLKKPEAWSWNQAAALPLVWLTARTCIACAEPYVRSAGTLAVLGGSSATGMYVVHLAKRWGWKVVATCSGRNADLVKSMGADEVVDYTRANVRHEVETLKPDAIVDCVGGTECVGTARRYVTIVGDKIDRMRMGGGMIYLWHPWMVWRWLSGKMGWGEVYDCIILRSKKEYLEEAIDLPADMVIIDGTFPFDHLKGGFERLNSGRASGKVVIEVSNI